MTERSFLEYRLDVARTMPESPYKTALIASIHAKLSSLRDGSNYMR